MLLVQEMNWISAFSSQASYFIFKPSRNSRQLVFAFIYRFAETKAKWRRGAEEIYRWINFCGLEIKLTSDLFVLDLEKRYN